RVRRRPRGRLVLHEGRSRPPDRRHEPELPRAAAARALLDDDVPGQLSVDDRDVRALDLLPPEAFAAAAAPWFEGAPRFLRRLAAARPSRTESALFGRADEIAQGMPEEEQLELIAAHPRLGAPPATVSASSFREQGYDRETAAAIADLARL